uniref:Uncharacterized protein n=1 Tax=Ascaris lumbricoides TaxID=6252 RepID=A0A9J2P5X4_ASCLU
MKRSAASVKSLPHYEDVCRTIIRNNFEPIIAFEKNGTLVEVQQDSQHRLVTTLVECERQFSYGCHGIDTSIYSSECITLYEYRKAYVRRIGTTMNFVEGLIKVNVATFYMSL